MTIQLMGLGGFDSSGVVEQLVAIASKPIADLDRKKGLVDSASLTMNAFSSKLTALESAARALATPSGFSSVAASSTDEAIVAQVSGGASVGSFAIEVQQLARAQKSRSGAHASATEALGQQGDLTIRVGDGEPVTVSIDSTDSLSDIASKIGQSGARVSVALINAGGAYHLTLQGLDTGTDAAFTISEEGTVSLGLSSPSSLVETAEDARFTLDGLAVTRSTNQIADVIPGVTLALTKTTSAPATLEIRADSTALEAKLRTLVNAYNDVVNAGHSATGYGSTKATNLVLAADAGIRSSLDRIAAIVSGAVPNAGPSFGSLAAVGVNLTRDGALVFDAAKLTSALDQDPAAVRRLFVTDEATGATGVMKTLGDAIATLVSGDGGAIKSRIESLSAQSKRLLDSRAVKDKRLGDYEQSLRRQFARLDQAMSRYQAMSGALGGLLNPPKNT